MKREHQSSEQGDLPNHSHIVREDHVCGVGKLKVAVFDDPFHGSHHLLKRRAAYPCETHRREDDVLQDLHAELLGFDVNQLIQQTDEHIERWGYG